MRIYNILNERCLLATFLASSVSQTLNSLSALNLQKELYTVDLRE
jgi:hypothetical protein